MVKTLNYVVKNEPLPVFVNEDDGAGVVKGSMVSDVGSNSSLMFSNADRISSFVNFLQISELQTDEVDRTRKESSHPYLEETNKTNLIKNSSDIFYNMLLFNYSTCIT